MASSERVIVVDAKGNVESVLEPGTAAARERLHWVAWLLDSSIPIPGTTFTVGLDAVIGLVPVLGDLIGVLLSTYILGEAARLGAPRSLLMRMSFNVAVEGVVGMIPVLGDAFDAAWKANQKNVRLLDGWLDSPRKARRSSRLFAVLLVLVVASFLGLLCVLGYVLWKVLFTS